MLNVFRERRRYKRIVEDVKDEIKFAMFFIDSYYDSSNEEDRKDMNAKRDVYNRLISFIERRETLY